MNKNVEFGTEARDKLLAGVDKAVNATKITAGLKGELVLIRNFFKDPQDGIQKPYWRLSSDGVTIMRQMFFRDPHEDVGASMVRSACERTVSEAGDGPQPLYSKVLTPKGFVSMGTLKIGDEVCGTDGTIQKVEGVFPKGTKEIYKIHFFDNRVVECCEDHLWEVTNNDGKKEVKTVREIIDSGNIVKAKNNGSVQHGYFTPTSAVDFIEDKTKMPIDPYLLGLLLGDGSLKDSGSIELSLGTKKEHVIKKIILPEGLNLNIKFVEDKNYFRVKINGMDENGQTSHKIINSLGLLNAGSSTKFIPKEYLYSSVESRIKLLQGLLDTDGYINKRGRFEYSTVSEQLAKDVLELVRGLGKSAGVWKLERTKDSSYSMTPIYRIMERKGFKYGAKLKKVEPTGVYTEMQCIKVSNEDNLYITDNYIVTHNTTATAILCQSLMHNAEQAVKDGANPVALVKGMEIAKDYIVEQIAKHSQKVRTFDGEGNEIINQKLIEEVTLIAAHSDPEVGGIVAKAINEVGYNGMITVEDNIEGATILEKTEGALLTAGLCSNYLVTDRTRNRAVLDNPYILLYDRKIDLFKPLLPIIEQVVKQNGSLLIVCKECSGEALSSIVSNVQAGRIRVAVVQMHEIGKQARNVLEDMAMVTGGQYISDEKLNKLEKVNLNQLGRAEKILVEKDKTIIIPVKMDLDGKEDNDLTKPELEYKKQQNNLFNYLLELSSQIANLDGNDKKLVEERRAKLTGGVAVIKVGGTTPEEIMEKKDRVEDALCASRACIEEGVVAGGGSLYLKICNTIDMALYDNLEGYSVVINALSEPFKQLMVNAGLDPKKHLNEIQVGEDNIGYNLATDQIEDLRKAGVIDCAKVLRCCIENSVGTASLFIRTGASVMS